MYSFYPRDAVLAQVLDMAPCLYRRLSVTTHKSKFCQNGGRIELVFGMGASFDLSYAVL